MLSYFFSLVPSSKLIILIGKNGERATVLGVFVSRIFSHSDRHFARRLQLSGILPFCMSLGQIF